MPPPVRLLLLLLTDIEILFHDLGLAPISMCSEAGAQHWFKERGTWIRLLPARCLSLSFSTALTQSGHDGDELVVSRGPEARRFAADDST